MTMLHCPRVSAFMPHTIAAAILTFAMATGAIAQTQPTVSDKNQRLDQVAIDLMRESAEFLASRPAFSFTWFVSYDEVVEDREKITFVRSGSNLVVRDKGFFSRADGENGRREYFYNQKQFVISAPDENFYAAKEFNDGFEALVEKVRNATDTEIPIYAIMSRNLGNGLEQGLQGAAYLGSTNLAGRPVHHLAFSEQDEDWQIWISTDNTAPLPLMIIGTNTKQKGWPQYRAYLTNWNLKPKYDTAQFSFRPDDDDLKVTMPELKKRNAGSPSAAGKQQKN